MKTIDAEAELDFATVMLKVPEAKRHTFARNVSREIFDAAPFRASPLSRALFATVINRVAEHLGVEL